MRKLVLLVMLYFILPNAHAAEFKCNKEQDPSKVDIVGYLKKYDKHCTQEIVKTYDLLKTSVPPAEWSVAVADMWQDIGNKFATLASQVDNNSKMKLNFERLASRAKLAESEVRGVSSLKELSEDSISRKVWWEIPPYLHFPPDQSSADPQPSMIDVEMDIATDCADRSAEVCKLSFNATVALMLQWRLAHKLTDDITDEVLDATAKQVAQKNQLWERYLYDSKPMLLLDFLATDWFSGSWSESDESFKDGYPVPPPTQYFFLHPSVGMEYMSSADDGEQFEPVLYVEIFGANRWDSQNRWIDVPGLDTWSGFSLVLSYADRAGVEDVGWGGLFTFSNVYSIGVVDYDGDTGFFLSADLANLWRDKYKGDYQKDKGNYQTYRDQIKNF